MTADLEAALRHPGAGAADDDILPALVDAAEREGLLDVAYATTDSPVGSLVLAVGDRGLLTCSYDDESAVLERVARRVSPRVLRAPRRLDGVRRQLDDYFAGRSRRIDVPVDLRVAAPFARAVLQAAAAIPYGATTSYAAIAAQVGKPNAARAVGNALGANPVCIVVPCHRVLRAGGNLGGYAGGVDIKRRLLELESAAPPAA